MVRWWHSKHCKLLYLHSEYDGCKSNGNGDEESEEFYSFPAMGHGGSQSDDGNVSEQDREEHEQAHVDRRVAEMNLHSILYNKNNHDETISDHERQILESLQIQYVQRRWECLYDSNEHARLCEAIMNQLVTTMTLTTNERRN